MIEKKVAAMRMLGNKFLVLIATVSSEASDEPLKIHSLIRAFAANTQQSK